MEIFISYAIKTISVLFVFGILIFFHELGHFFIAKKLKVIVEKFSLGFGPALFKFKKGETEYAISAVPFGGYVKMAGESLNESKGKEGEFYSKSPLQRIAIVAAGPIMSFALAFVIFYIVIMTIGTASVNPQAKVGGLIEGNPAERVGIKESDLIIAIDNQPIDSWQQMSGIIKENPGKEIFITLDRESKILSFYVTPKEEILSNGQKIGQIGIYPNIITEKANPFTAVYKSAETVGKTSYMIISGLVELIRGKVPAKEALGGPILIARITARLSEAGFMQVLNFAGMLSIVLGILNLLPIPILDGGVIFFFIIEIIRKKPLSEKTQMIAQNIGLALLLGVMLFATYNDLTRDYSKIFPKAEKTQKQNVPR
ncbi:RIP metalloprotease RseP [bacterium]|nr:RIP metalloprotease RseP [bacterium]